MIYREIRKTVYCKKDNRDVLTLTCEGCPHLHKFVECPDPDLQKKFGYLGLYCDYEGEEG